MNFLYIYSVLSMNISCTDNKRVNINKLTILNGITQNAAFNKHLKTLRVESSSE